MKVALVGQPNSGKSTLFNAVAGYRSLTSNFAGTTVEYTLLLAFELRDQLSKAGFKVSLTRTTDASGSYRVANYDSLGNTLTRISYSSGGTALAKAAYDGQ